MIMKGQQTYGHPHHMTSAWIPPPHMMGMDSNIISQSVPHSHSGMYTVTHQPITHMYYDMDSLSAPRHTMPIHHHQISEHLAPLPPSLQQQEQLTSQQHQQSLPVAIESDPPAVTYPAKSYSPVEDDSQHSLDLTDGSANSKSHSTPMTLKWLNDNYEVAEGVCIPRSTLYQHYIEFCEAHELNPVNAASFGKIIRQQFPQITTRRLGTRGQSKYHYYGIGVREQSPYYDFVYSKAGLQSANTAKKETPKQPPVQAYSPRSKMGTLLPDFPDVGELKLPEDIESEKLLTFIMMYRTHCQRILDTVIRANFDEVENFLLHFWQGMPAHMTAILAAPPIVGMVAICDTILYKAICNVLMPHVLQPLPESLTLVIKKFAKQLEDWIAVALNDLPDSLRDMKLTMARKFSRILRLQLSLNHLCQASRSVVNSADIMSQMLDDWQAIDRKTIIKQTQLTLSQQDMVSELLRINRFYDEFEGLLQDQVTIESFIEWLDKIINESIVKTHDNKIGSVKRKSQNFLLVWSAFSTKIIRDMTLHSAPSFGSFHLLHLMFDDYILYHLEHMCCSEVSDEILSDIRGTPKVSSISTHIILPSTAIIDNSNEIVSNENNNQHNKPIPTQHHITLPLITAESDTTANMVTPQLQATAQFITSSHVELLSHLTESVSSAHSEANNKLPDNCVAENGLAAPIVMSNIGPTMIVSSTSNVNMASTTEGSSHTPVSATGQQPNNLAYYMNDLANVEQTWRIEDSIPPPPLQYHGENYNVEATPHPDILYYAVNSMNLPSESTMNNCVSSTGASRMSAVSHTPGSQIPRITYDHSEAEEALERSFQPFTHLLYSRDGKTTRTPKHSAPSDEADQQDSIHLMSKRFREDNHGSVRNYESVPDNYITS